jgi:hypothetical protein
MTLASRSFVEPARELMSGSRPHEYSAPPRGQPGGEKVQLTEVGNTSFHHYATTSFPANIHVPALALAGAVNVRWAAAVQ